MQFDWSTLALQTVNFAVLVWLLHRFLYRPVLRMVDARRSDVDSQYAAAAEAKAEAEARLKAVEAGRAGIAAERAVALRAATAEAEESAAARHSRAEREAAAMIEEARSKIAAEREQALAEMRDTALDLGTGVARRLLAEVPTALRAEAWLERIEQHLTGLPSAERDGIVEGLNSHGTLRVVTATPLPEEVAAEWRKRLGQALGDGFRVAFGADEALVAGAELHFPNAVLRFSWRSALTDIQQEIEADADAG